MLQKTRIVYLTLLIGIANFLLAQSSAAQLPEIPYTKFQLDNGLTVIVHEDHKAPIVSVNIWYHVGSKNEPQGKSGFAHLFEHLMFNGSENFNDDYFQVLERVGATDLNGTTNFDRTNYFQNVPTNALDRVLWMESDRMGHLLGAVDQAKLDEQRGVVQNEKRQGENQPYGKVFNTLLPSIYPHGHPYAHSVIGSMEDLNAASLQDVQEWFTTYYGPNNAIVVIAGDITPELARSSVEKYFGDIPPSPPISKQAVWVAKRSGTQRQIMQDRVPQARLYKVWNVPEAYNSDTNKLDLVASLLTQGKNSRLYNRLVYEAQLATDVQSFVQTGEVASRFMIQATAIPGGDLVEVERLIDDEMARLLAEGPTQQELTRVKTQARAAFVRGMERIGGFGGKSDILAQSEIYGGSPDAYKRVIADQQEATAAELTGVANTWLGDGVYVMEVHPFPPLRAITESADRTRLPDVSAPPSVSFPSLQRTELANGLKVVLAERHATPVVSLRLMINAGFASDHSSSPGTAALAMNMLDEGTQTRTSLEINEALAMLGATLATDSDLDFSMVSLNALTENLAESLVLFADVILNPSFPQAELDRLKQQQIALIQREMSTPNQMVERVIPKLLYGENHAYGQSFTGSGSLESVRSLERDDLNAFVGSWIKPNNATLVVVGDVTMNQLRPMLEAQFAAWRPANVPAKAVGDVTHRNASSVYLIDRPDSLQSVIVAGHVAPAVDDASEIAINAMNVIIGGSFTSRINMNLREDKGWSYGARTAILETNGQRPFLVQAPVQTDRTAESMQEVIKELRGYVGNTPATRDEVARAQSNMALGLAGRWETNQAVGNSIDDIVRFGYDDDYYNHYADRVRALDVEDVAAKAREVLRPENTVWVVVGDLSKVEAGIRALNLGEVTVIDSEGNPVSGR